AAACVRNLDREETRAASERPSERGGRKRRDGRSSAAGLLFVRSEKTSRAASERPSERGGRKRRDGRSIAAGLLFVRPKRKSRAASERPSERGGRKTSWWPLNRRG